jgi:hypothetical protein
MPELDKESKLARTHELDKGSKLARTPELDKGSKLARTHELDKGSKLARMHELNKRSKLTRTPELGEGGELAETPKLFLVFAFAAVVWVALLSPQLPATTFGIIMPIDLRPMAAVRIPPGNIVVALEFAAAAAAAVASMFGGGGGRSLQHCSIAQRELVLMTLCKYVGEFCLLK